MEKEYSSFITRKFLGVKYADNDLPLSVSVMSFFWDQVMLAAQ